MTRVDVERLARLLDGDTVRRWDVSSDISGAEEHLLTVAAALRRGSPPPPGPEFTATLRANLVASARARSTSRPMPEQVRWAYEDLAGRLRYSLRATGMTAAVAACLAIAGIGLGAERSNPLDPLYGTKLSLEQARLAVISDGLERAAREMSYSKDRVVEAWGAMERGDSPGVVVALHQADMLVRSGSPAWITEDPPTIATIVSEQRTLVVDLIPLIDGDAVTAAQQVVLTMDGVLAQAEPG
ncbi:MAG: hypothetical protein ACRDZO_27940 [Egibacteraceae bacterium]